MTSPVIADRTRAVRLASYVAVILAGAFAIAILAFVPSDAKFGFDLDAYLGAAEHLTAGVRIYPLPDAGGGITLGPAGIYPYPPIWAAAFVPLTVLPRDAVFAGWLIGLVVLAIAVGMALVRPLPPQQRYWAAAGYLAFLPLISELRFGNLNLITLALCLLAWSRRDRPVVAGILFALAIGLKLLPIALLVFFVVGGRWRIVAWLVLAWAIAVVTTWPWIGPQWTEYVAVTWAIITGTPAVSVVPGPMTTPPWRYVLPTAAVAVAAVAGLASRRDPSLERSAFTTSLAAAPLLANTVWYTYLIMALPALLGSDGKRPALAPIAPAPVRIAGWLLMEIPVAILLLLGLGATICGGLARLVTRPAVVLQRYDNADDG